MAVLAAQVHVHSTSYRHKREEISLSIEERWPAGI